MSPARGPDRRTRRHAREAAMVRTYHLFKRKPIDGTLGMAIRVHAQACGFVAYVFDVHPDTVARAVADDAQERRA